MGNGKLKNEYVFFQSGILQRKNRDCTLFGCGLQYMGKKKKVGLCSFCLDLYRRETQKGERQGNNNLFLTEDIELQSLLSHRKIPQKFMQDRYTENPEQETGLEKDKKKYGI